MPLPPTGLLLSSQLGRMIGAAPGDVVTVEVLEGRREQFDVPVAGWLDDYVGVGAYLRLDLLHRLLAEQDAISGAWLGVEAGQRDAVLSAVAALPTVGGVSSSARRVAAFDETFGR